MSANQHVVLLRKSDKLVGGGELIRCCVVSGTRMYRPELHLVLGLELAKLCTESRGVRRFTQVPRIRGRTE